MSRLACRRLPTWVLLWSIFAIGVFILVLRDTSAILKNCSDGYVRHTLRATSIKCKPRPPPSKLLTLFTTVKSSPSKWHIERNMLENWALLKDRVNLVLYHTEPNSSSVGAQMRALARKSGWTVRRCPLALRKLPVLRAMFLDATKSFNTPYYAYSNSDILFTKSLVDTLDGLYGYRFKDVLMVGKRRNYNVSHGERLVQWDTIEEQAEMSGSLFQGYAQDYFISTRFGYPWRTVYNFVVGRIGYDNWLIVNAILKDIPVIDLSDTVLALHQTDKSGNYEGHSNKTKDNVHINFDIVGKAYDYTDYAVGDTECAQLHTTLYASRNKTSLKLQFRKAAECREEYRMIHKNYRYFRFAVRNKTCEWDE